MTRRSPTKLAAVALVLAAACGKVEPDRGGLMLLLSEDGDLGLDRLELRVTAGDKLLLESSYRLPKEASLPTTVSIVSNNNPTATAAIHVVGWRGTTPVDVRDNIVKQIPVDRVTALRIVLSARCTDQVVVVDGEATSKCDAGSGEQTCSPTTGGCVTAEVNASRLDVYQSGDEDSPAGGGAPSIDPSGGAPSIAEGGDGNGPGPGGASDGGSSTAAGSGGVAANGGAGGAVSGGTTTGGSAGAVGTAGKGGNLPVAGTSTGGTGGSPPVAGSSSGGNAGNAGTAGAGGTAGEPGDTPPWRPLTITAAPGEHKHTSAGVDTRAKSLGKLVVDVGVSAGAYMPWLAKRGYHSIGAPCGSCPSPDLGSGRDAVGTCRLGEFATTEASVKSTLASLQSQFPEEDWGYFLNQDGSVRWSDVAFTGVSHGATTAAVAGRLGARMWRVVSRSGPRDDICGLGNGQCTLPLTTPYDVNCADADVASWLDQPSKTPMNRFYGLVGVLDGQCGDIIFNMHRTQYPGVPTIFDVDGANFASTNQFVASTAGHFDFLAAPTITKNTEAVLNIAFAIPPENQNPAF